MSLSISPNSAISDLKRQIARSHRKRQGCPTVVVLQAAADHTGAYNNFFASYDIRQLAKTHYVVYRVIHRTDSIHRIINKIYRTRGPIQSLIIRGHGDTDAIQLGNKTTFHASDLTPQDFRAFDRSATILLDACYSGQKLAEPIHQASKLAVFAPMRISNVRNTYIHACDQHGIEMCSTDELAHASLASCPFRAEVLAERFQYIQKRAAAGHAIAQTDLAICYSYGMGTLPSEPLAIQWLTRAADQGNARAQCYLGNHYLLGHGVAQSFDRAAYWYALAAQHGFAPAARHLGDCYSSGHGVAQSLDRAFQWYSYAAKQGDSVAQYALAGCYYFGQGVARSFERAAYWFTRSAKQENVGAQFFLGKCYREGKGVPQSKQQALYWFERAARNGDVSAAQEIDAIKRPVQIMLGAISGVLIGLGILYRFYIH